MFVILPTRDTARSLCEVFGQWHKKAPAQVRRTLPAPLTQDQCEELVQALVTELVDDRQLWVRRKGHHLEHKLFVIYPELTQDQYEQLYKNFFDQIEIEYHPQIQLIVPKDTWNVWYIRPMCGDLALESGSDYRAMDWQRRMESGEWSWDD